MTLLDWLIIAVTIVLVLGVGFRLSRRQRDEVDYFLGGRTIDADFAAGQTRDQGDQGAGHSAPRRHLRGLRGCRACRAHRHTPPEGSLG